MTLGKIMDLVLELNRTKQAAYWLSYSGHIKGFDIKRSITKKDYTSGIQYLTTSGWEDGGWNIIADSCEKDLCKVYQLLKEEPPEYLTKAFSFGTGHPAMGGAMLPGQQH